MGLLNNKNSTKIFPNISSSSSTLYQPFEKYLLENKIEGFYTIPNEQAKKYIDDREDSLSEIAKLYYQFLPIISLGGFSKEIYINQSYLIAYEYNNDTKDIIGDYLYFSYPRINNVYIILAIFIHEVFLYHLL